MIFLQQVKDYVAGNPVENAHGAIIMFGMCSAMKWAHLPVAGGLYDQDPELLRCWRLIWDEQARRQAAEDKKREAEARQRKSGGGRVAGRRR